MEGARFEGRDEAYKGLGGGSPLGREGSSFTLLLEGKKDERTVIECLADIRSFSHRSLKSSCFVSNFAASRASNCERCLAPNPSLFRTTPTTSQSLYCILRPWRRQRSSTRYGYSPHEATTTSPASPNGRGSSSSCSSRGWLSSWSTASPAS